jgi:hypothetical protein
MPTPIEQLLSRTVYATDGTTTIWDFSFEDGYLDPTHVKAYTTNATGARVDLTILPEYLIGEFQLQITPALAADLELTIYRDTPKNAPLVDFTDESSFSEVALDTNARQAIMVAAEAIDVVNTSDVQAAVAAAEAAGNAAAASAIDAATAASSASSAGIAAAAADASAIDAANSAALINPANFATSAQGAKADTALQPGSIGVTVASQANGALAATALQPASIGASVQGYDAATAKINALQTFTASQRGIVTIDNDLSFNMAVTNNFKCTPAGSGTLTFTNIAAGQAGTVLLVNGANYTISAAATTKIKASSLTAISTTGTYKLGYWSDGTNVYITASGNLA